MPALLTAFLVGVMLCSLASQLGPAWLPPLFAILAVAAWHRRSRIHRLCAALLMGLAVGASHAHAWQAEQLPVACERLPLWVEGRVSGLPHRYVEAEGRQWQRFHLELEQPLGNGCSGPQQLLLTEGSGLTLFPGERWRFRVRLRLPWGLENPGASNRQRWLAEAGIDAVGSVSSTAPAQRLEAGGWSTAHQRLRQHLSERISRSQGASPASQILAALAVGDRSALDPGLWRIFQQFGVGHLLVISGLHVGMVAACGLLLGSVFARLLLVFGISRWNHLAAPLAALMLATVYTALAGFSLATSRAWLMLVTLLCARLCGRPALTWHNLLLAAVALVALNPLVVLGAGFWLSFSAVACLLWFSAWRRRGGGWWLAHGFMAVAMLPVSGAWFGGASLVAAISNALLVPMVGTFVVPLVLAGTLAALLGSGLADLLWSLAAWPFEQLLPVATAVAARYPAGVYRMLASTPLALYLAAAAPALACLPLRWPRKALLLILPLPLLLPFANHRVASPQAVHVMVLDVGQGTSVLLYDREHALLYDTGGGPPGGVSVAERAVIPVLRQRGIRHLDTLLVSHGDHDHSAGLAILQAELSPAGLLVGADLSDIRGAQPCRAGQAWQWREDVRFQLLAPAPGEHLSRNDGSCVLRVVLPGTELLLPGDISARRERTLVRYWGEHLHSHLALAAHHGSKTSSSWAWLGHVRPRRVIYTHGRANAFGHPATTVVQRHQALDIDTLSTAHTGALEWVLEPGERPVLLQHRALQPRYWKR
ncbi:DNA internalization-related competence protein ComEC/Rec2 [Haliea sp.]|uniref:DNA internalization-related competence protein ComEC/Rec2 n=1 Tax=Haliea sp. TaxID=1932666 RepID=UPI003528C3E8